MILIRILDFLRERQVAGLGEIARAAGSTPDAVRPMLQTLERKGRVHLVRAPAGCGASCRQCDPGSVEIYGYGTAPDPAVHTTVCGSRGH